MNDEQEMVGRRIFRKAVESVANRATREDLDFVVEKIIAPLADQVKKLTEAHDRNITTMTNEFFPELEEKLQALEGRIEKLEKEILLKGR